MIDDFIFKLFTSFEIITVDNYKKSRQVAIYQMDSLPIGLALTHTTTAKRRNSRRAIIKICRNKKQP